MPCHLLLCQRLGERSEAWLGTLVYFPIRTVGVVVFRVGRVSPLQPIQPTYTWFLDPLPMFAAWLERPKASGDPLPMFNDAESESLLQRRPRNGSPGADDELLHGSTLESEKRETRIAVR